MTVLSRRQNVLSEYIVVYCTLCYRIHSFMYYMRELKKALKNEMAHTVQIILFIDRFVFFFLRERSAHEMILRTGLFVNDTGPFHSCLN